VSAIRLQIRAPNLSASIHAVITFDPPDIQYEIKQGQDVILDSANAGQIQDAFDELEKLGGQKGQLLNLSKLGDPKELLRWIMAFEPKVDCRHGRFDLLGENHEGYILKLIFLDSFHMRFCFSEMGELILIEGIPEIVIVGEAFAPEEKDVITE
jgi:hypothetical protein